MNELRVADIIVSTTGASVSAGIRSSIGADVSHAMLYAGEGFVIEAVGDGVRKADMASISFQGATLAICLRRRGMDHAKRAAVVEAASDYIGKPYDGFAAAGSGTSNRRGMTLAMSLLGPLGTAAMRALANDANSRDDRFFCSELVARAYERAGLPISQLPANQTNPRTLRTSTNLMYVGHLVGKIQRRRR